MSAREKLRALSEQTDAAPERITDDELAYHQRVVRDAQQAEAMLAEVERVIATARAMQAATVSWTGHLAEKYGLVDGDSVAQDGRIVRASDGG